MNADRIVIHPIPYISLHISTSMLGSTAEMQMLCAHVTQHWIRELKVITFSFTGAFSVNGRYRWGSLICWLRGNCLCTTEDLGYSQINQCLVVHANVSNTAQHFLLLTFLCESLMVEDAKCELVQASNLSGEAHLDLTWGVWALRLSYIKSKGYGYCLKLWYIKHYY